MPKFSQKSLDKLRTCHPDLIRLFLAVIEEYDCIVLEGHRGEAEQNEAFAKGNSKLQYPHSRHNQTPSMAADVGPWPLKWDDLESFKKFGKFVMTKATELKIDLVWGADWNGNGDISDEKFKDFPHFELKSSINK